MSLTEYNQKRNFQKTTEPKGEILVNGSNRFVIQYHEARAKHYDFRLEHDGVLLSWAVPKGLSMNPNQKRLAVHVEDHPADYIDFEGIIPKGNYGAGTVEIYDSGNYMPLGDFKTGLKKGHIKFVLNGEKLKGGWSLIKTDEKNWIIVKTQDEYASTNEKSNKTKIPFKQCLPQLATLSGKVPSGKDWIFEIKYDGYRVMARKENGKVKLLSRNNLDCTNKFKQISMSVQKIDADGFVLDGEVVVFDEFGRSNFGLLQEHIKRGEGGFCYVVFDLLAKSGEDIRTQDLLTRKNKLERLLFKADKSIMYSSHVEDGASCFEFAKEHGLEGVIAKKKASVYSGERNSDWLKIKCYKRQEFVVLGYTVSDKNELLSALLVGYYHGKDLVFAGKVGTGFSSQAKVELHSLFQKYLQEKCPLSEPMKIKNAKWLTPKFVAEIQYAEFTKENVLRQPSFLGLRNDKSPQDVILEEKV